jgi:integrase
MGEERGIRKLPNGAYEVRVYVSRDPITGKVRQLSRTVRGTLPAARTVRARLLTEVADGKHGGASTTFGALLDDWLEHREKMGASPTTLAGDREKIERVIRPGLGTVKLAKLGARHLDSLYAAHQGRSVRHYHRLIHAVLEQAFRWGWVDTNVAKRARPGPVAPVAIKPPNATQLRKLLTAARASRRRDLAQIVQWAAMTGMRRGEICGLRWHDVDWTARTVQVRRSIYQVGTVVAEKDPKTHQARTIQVSDEALAVLMQRLKDAQADATVLGLSIERNGYVWSRDELGNLPMAPDSLTTAFHAAAERAGVPCRFHDLRHFVGTELISRGHDVVTVAQQLGHARVSTTVDLYAHGREETARAAADELGSILGTKEG